MPKKGGEKEAEIVEKRHLIFTGYATKKYVFSDTVVLNDKNKPKMKLKNKKCTLITVSSFIVILH